MAPILPPVLWSALLAAPVSGHDAVWTDADPGHLLRADASAWDRAPAATWGPAPYRTGFRALWSAAGLHLRFDAEDDDPWFTMSERDAPIWEEEVVEIFLDPVGDGRYIEVEVNPAGVVCDLRRLGPGESGSDEIPVPAGVMDRGFDVAGLEVSVGVSVADSTADSVGGWTATAFLPWRGLGLAAAPEPGTTMAFNVFRIKRPGGPEAPADGAVFAAWSPTGSPSFHAPEAFRPLRLRPAPDPPSPK